MERADVVIIGGGVIGAAAAYHLALRGVTDVVLLERDTLAAGSTSRSAGGVRLQFADELNIQIMKRSLPVFEQWEAVIGEHVGYVSPIALHQVGYLFLLDTSELVETFRGAVELQHSLGVETHWLTPAEAGELAPGIVTHDLLAATWNPREGHCSPEAVTHGFAAVAAAHGVRIEQGLAATGIRVEDGRIASVRTAAGEIATDTVICAAGAWSPEIGAMVGVDLPVRGEKRWMWFSPENGGLPGTLPLTVDFSTGFYCHREGPGIVFGGREPDLGGVAEHALRRLPVIGELPVARDWWGYYEVSPDHNAILGEVAGGPGRLIVATGFSGHGFQQAPAIGEHLAEVVTGVVPSLDLSAFALARFADGEAREERFVV